MKRQAVLEGKSTAEQRICCQPFQGDDLASLEASIKRGCDLSSTWWDDITESAPLPSMGFESASLNQSDDIQAEMILTGPRSGILTILIDHIDQREKSSTRAHWQTVKTKVFTSGVARNRHLSLVELTVFN
ncbi:hypothetical protein R3P38DRAFT_2772458 [Favolaschia claudopus]|uniref:Uncharacterized protein n=1 Tax=Favolaschia claudopus TaxID=2862362 RepID=A0AAW0C6E2_9AGAR